MRELKGQSAIEYLTTYGWMLLVVAIVGGAIFTTVQNSAQIQSVSGLSNADIQVSDYGLNNDGLQLSLRAAATDQVDIQKVEITDPEKGVSADITPSQVVPVGDTTTVNLQDVQTIETSGTYDMNIVYDTGGLEGLVAEGQITGSFGVFNRINLEEAKFNRSTNELQIDVKNTGDNTTDSISYTVEATNTEFTGNLPNLDAGETSQINITTDETYPLESVSLDAEGARFIDSSSGLKCTPTKGLVGYWTFNDEQTRNGWAVDLSGYGNNGSLKGGVSSVPMRFGRGYSLDGQDDLIRVPDSESLGVDSDLTVSLWYRSFQNEKGDYSYILKKGQFGGSSYFWTDSAADNLRVGARITDSTDDWHGIFDFKPNVDYGNLVYLAYTYNSTEGRLTGYSDGKNITTETPGSYTIQQTNNDVVMGKGGPAGNLKADMDEVRIHNRSLSQKEIQRLYNVRNEDWAVSGCKLTG